MLIFLKELLENTNETVINIRIYFFYFSNRKLISGVEFSLVLICILREFYIHEMELSEIERCRENYLPCKENILFNMSQREHFYFNIFSQIKNIVN